jgi:hypothetical protein
VGIDVTRNERRCAVAEEADAGAPPLGKLISRRQRAGARVGGPLVAEWQNNGPLRASSAVLIVSASRGITGGFWTGIANTSDQSTVPPGPTGLRPRVSSTDAAARPVFFVAGAGPRGDLGGWATTRDF